MGKEKVYDVAEYTVGSKDVIQEKIIFATEREMDEAKQDILDSKDIKVRIKDEKYGYLIISVDNKMISDKFYKGEIQLVALDKKEENK